MSVAASQAFERTRASVAAALREGARVVALTPPPGSAPGRLLRASVADAGGCLVDGRAADLEELASRILAGLGAPPFVGAAGVLRAFAAHLRSRSRRLVVGIVDPAELPARTLRELGPLLQERGGLALVLESGASDPELWTSLGVAPTRVQAPAVPAVRTDSTPRRRRRLHFGLAVAAGLAAATLTGTLLASPEPSQGPLAERAASVAPAGAEAAPVAEPGLATSAGAPEVKAPPLPAYAEPHLDEPDAVHSGRRALAALANARSDAEWEEGTRILHEIGPQPALMDALDQLGAKPGCVRKRGCVSTRARLEAALCTAWADAVERGEVPAGLRCS